MALKVNHPPRIASPPAWSGGTLRTENDSWTFIAKTCRQMLVVFSIQFILRFESTLRVGHLPIQHIMEYIFDRTFVLRTVLLLSAIAVSLSNGSIEEDFDSHETSTTSRRLLQKTFYTMPTLNFCETSKCSCANSFLDTCLTPFFSETGCSCCCDLWNIWHRLRFQTT